MSATIRVGMSGFSFASWTPGFYPKGTKAAGMLPYFATRFSTVELNNTYYRTPKQDAIDAWRRGAPDGFRFAVKAVRWISYTLRPGDMAEPFERFLRLVDGLGDTLGPVLIQTPRGARFDAERLTALLDVLPPGRAYAFEPRHASFRDPDAMRLLRGRGVAWCLDDDVFDPGEYVTTASFAYMRFREERYDETALKKRAEQLDELARRGTDVYAYFRHQDEPACVLRALDFLALLSS